MTPAARYAAAIDVLDVVLGGTPAEKALLAWSRASRFAGSKDRAAVRDHVFDVLRKRRVCEGLGQALTGRGLILGLLRAKGEDVGAIFSGTGYGPSVLTAEELSTSKDFDDLSDAERANLPDDIWSLWEESLGSSASLAAEVASERGPICLRVNTRLISRNDLITSLAKEDMAAKIHPECATAVLVTNNERRLVASEPFRLGQFEMQDASSQQAMALLDVAPDMRVLDFCAGGGGKALALADIHDSEIVAHDVNAQRMVDIPVRAERAGARVSICADTNDLEAADYDVVLVDAPCSGSGTWRRTPDEKWRADVEKVIKFSELQLEILSKSSKFVKLGGSLFYATCSVFDVECTEVVKAFLAGTEGWEFVFERKFELTSLQDGFFIAQLKRV